MNTFFTFTGARKIVFGNGSFAHITEFLEELKITKPLIVLDNNLSVLGFQKRLKDIFSLNDLEFEFYDQVEAEPPLECADTGAAIALQNKCNGVVGIGGGSSMDVAKAIAVLVTNRAKAQDYLGLNKVPAAGLPMVMVPTTAGTGSEVTFTAVFKRPELNKKEGMNSPYLYPDVALLDPELTLSVPSNVTATTGIDALCHAIESYTSVNSSPISEMISLKAIELIASNLRTCVHDGKNLPAREKVLLGSLYAGLGLANAGVGAVHSLSYPLGGKYGVPHGLANTVLLPAVMRYNTPAALEKFVFVAEAMGEITEGMPLREAAYLAVEAVEELILDCGVAGGLEFIGVPESDFPELAETAMTVARPLANNPRKVDVENAIEIYHDAY